MMGPLTPRDVAGKSKSGFPIRFRFSHWEPSDPNHEVLFTHAFVTQGTHASRWLECVTHGSGAGSVTGGASVTAILWSLWALWPLWPWWAGAAFVTLGIVARGA